MKSALIIRHVPFEGVAGFRQPLIAAGYRVERVDVTDPDFDTIDLTEPDLLIMMGGPMGVYEQDRHPWIAGEIQRLAARLAADRPTLGVCLGAQLIAAALGAEVYPGPVREVGFHPVVLHEAGLRSPVRHLADTPVLHWHGDTFSLPRGAELLASTSLYRHQAFRRGANVLALQFHAEMGEDERFYAWLEEWPEALAQACWDAPSLREAHDSLGSAAVAAGRAMITQWLAELGAVSDDTAGWDDEPAFPIQAAYG